MSEEAKPSPPWGALPAEQYLIRNWDWSSPLPRQAQTTALVRAFLALDDIPEEWDTSRRQGFRTDEETAAAMDRVPTADEIRTILQPWRPPRWRRAAARVWTERDDEAVWLRTYYGEGSDEKFAAWRDMDEDYDPNYEAERVEWTVLDDVEMFGGLGDQWWRVFDVLPELAGPIQGHTRRPAYGREEEVQALRAQLREDIERRRAGSSSSSAAAAAAAAGGEAAATLSGDDAAAVLEAEYGVHGQELQAAAVSTGTFLLVADARAWQTDCLRILHLDAKGNIVRHSTVDVADAWYTRCYWFAVRFRESPWWQLKHSPMTGEDFEEGAELGGKYRARGELGRLLYGLEL